MRADSSVVQARVGGVVDGRELEEPWHVVQRCEEEDRQDVEPGLDVVAEPEKGRTNSDVPGMRNKLELNSIATTVHVKSEIVAKSDIFRALFIVSLFALKIFIFE